MNFLSIEQIKKLDIVSASLYCDDLRQYLIENVSRSGGHLASNLGVTEISLALIRQFNSPYDKIIYDVGHQSYIHKLLTGRYFDWTNLRTFDGYSGFTKIDESVHDPFGAGHSSTSVSAALGFAKAAKLKGEDYYSIAVIGDGAFGSGMTFEALNNVSRDDRLIIVLNDNEMSISQNVGSVSAYLNKIRATSGYLNFKEKTKQTFNKLPLISKPVISFLSSIKNFMKRLFIKNTLFEDLGIYYLGPVDGNDLETVEEMLEKAKKLNRPVLVHFITKKGKGLKEAENNPNAFHFVSPKVNNAPNFSSKFGGILENYAADNPNVVAITAAMCDGTGLNGFKEKYPERFFDVGICEEHAATFSSALSRAGMNPFYAVYSTFFQRCYDQIVHDASLQSLKLTVALDRAGLVGSDGATHHGVFDVSMTLNLPNSMILSPSTFKELQYSFNECVKHPYLSFLRYPKDTESKISATVFTKISDFMIDAVKKCDILFITYGRITDEVIKAKILLEKKGFQVVIVKFLKLKPINFNKISRLVDSLSPSFICCVEEGMKIGGFSEYLLSNLSVSALTKIIAIDETFVPQGTNDQLFEYCGISAKNIYEKVIKWIKVKKQVG